MARFLILGALINLNHPAIYLHWHFILISLPNLIVIVVMLALFILALVLPFVGSKDQLIDQPPPPAETVSETIPEPLAGTWTGKLRRAWLKVLPPAKLLPDSQPSYVASWIYVFGVLTIGGLAMAILSGLILALKGPTWWHDSSYGHFVNSLHLWSVELFMAFMTVHLWGKFWMAAWRDKRWATWMTGVIAFLVSIFEAFTGYLSQTNFDSQWIAFEAKDALNAAGFGRFFNAMNFGQALMLHIVLVPLVLVALVALHVLLVRIRGVVHPIGVHSLTDSPPEVRNASSRSESTEVAHQ
jgi:quinol-cytochrome oxidoreductase complex cytochrome b subunit